MPNFTHEDYVKMVDEAERELSALLSKAESSTAAGEPLAKSEESDKKDDDKDDAKEEPAKAEEDKEDKKDDEQEHDYDDEDQEEMHKMYHSMSKGELKLHKDSIEKCWMKKCGEMSVVKSEEKNSEGTTLAKSEDADAIKKAEEATSLLKSELEAAKGKIDESAKENAELKKSISELTAALDGFLKGKGPVRKAITSIEIVKKNENETGNKPEARELTKSDIKAKLTQKASDPSLSKSDRAAINKYCMVEGTSLDTVKHLLS